MTVVDDTRKLETRRQEMELAVLKRLALEVGLTEGGEIEATLCGFKVTLRVRDGIPIGNNIPPFSRV